MKFFILDGIEGMIDNEGWIRWYTINCWLKDLSDCPLKRAALSAK
jgi:hypothetical protein